MNYDLTKLTLIYSLFGFLILIGVCLILYLPRLIAWFAPLKKQKHFINDKKNISAI